MTESWEEYKILDHPSVLSLIFYPRKDYLNVSDTDLVMSIELPVEDSIKISCVFYFSNKSNPNILFFHGNGELASEYEDIGNAFNIIGVNLFAADYRGYGRSGGSPTVSNMIRDARWIFTGFKNILRDKGFTGSHFIMGRSLGSASAVELAAACPHEFNGLIIESGFCDIMNLLGRAGLSLHQPGQKTPTSPGLDRVMKITMPALVIHGEYDSIVPLAEGEKIYRNIGSADKKLVIIPGADHNTIFAEGMDQYLLELKDFVKLHK